MRQWHVRLSAASRSHAAYSEHVGGRWTTRRCPRPRGRLGTAASRRSMSSAVGSGFCARYSFRGPVRQWLGAVQAASAGAARRRLPLRQTLRPRVQRRCPPSWRPLPRYPHQSEGSLARSSSPGRAAASAPPGQPDTPASTRWVTGRKPSPQAAAAACAAP